MVSFSFVFGILLAWILSGCPDLSSTNSDTGTGEMSLLSASSLPTRFFSEFLQPLRDVGTQRRWLSSKQRVSPFYCGFLFTWFLVFGWLGSATRIGSKQRVSPFYHLFSIWAWHRYWMGICPTQIFPFSSLTVAWYCCSWWSRRAWGRCRMITLLSWRCHWGWRMRTGWRTRWQAWNHDRN